MAGYTKDECINFRVELRASQDHLNDSLARLETLKRNRAQYQEDLTQALAAVDAARSNRDAADEAISIENDQIAAYRATVNSMQEKLDDPSCRGF